MSENKDDLFADVTKKPEADKDFEIDKEKGTVRIGSKKFENVEALAKAKAAADAHIALIEAENAILKENVGKAGKTESLLADFERRLTDSLRPKQTQNTTVNDDTKQSSGMTAEQIKALVDAGLTEKETTRQREAREQKIKANQKLIRDKLVEDIGSPEEAKEAWEGFLKVSNRAVVNQLLEESPDDLLALFKVKTGNTAVTDTGVGALGSSVKRMDGSVSRGRGAVRGVKPYSYYSKLLTEEPSKYWAPETQAEIHAAFAKYTEAGLDPSQYTQT